MSYLVLARKYRPRTFAEVVGQEVATGVLKGALQEDRLGHAYLFAGPRGTGKTTIARILAKCLNCESGPTATPCGTCERCVGADEGHEVDIVELDAASHTGVDTIRELRDEVAYSPMRARMKVYIVDEVHMLSKGAFNALLKTLEEPPPHVVFLFATTEPHKVLDTILSRCQVLKLRPLADAEIRGRLDLVFEKEGIRAAEGVTSELARAANGGMRDALSLADKLLALAGEEPTLDDVARLGDDGGARAVEELLSALEAGERARMLATLEAFAGNEAELAASLLEQLRTAILVHFCGTDTPLASGGEDDRRASAERAKRLGGDRVELWMQELLRARERMRLFPGEERLVLEVTLLELCRAETTLPLAQLLERLEALEQGLPAPSFAPSAPAPAAPSTPAPAPPASPGGASAAGSTTRPAVEPTVEPTVEPAGELLPQPPAAPPQTPPRAPAHEAPGELWKPFLAELAATQPSMAELLRNRATLEPGPEGLRLCVRPADAGERKMLEGKRVRGTCARALAAAAGRELELQLVVEGGAPSEAAPTRPMEAAAEPPVTKDDFTSEVADLFGGVIEDLP